MTISTTTEGRWHLVGRLIRSYREDESHGGGPLSPGALLHLISVHKEIKGGTYNPDALKRWEDGKEPIPEIFLSDFCSALDISEPEVNSMKSLAGYGDASEGQQTLGIHPLRELWRVRDTIAWPGGYVSLGGFYLNYMQYDRKEVLIVYVLGLLALVIGLLLWHRRKSGKTDELVDELYFVSMLVVLNAPLMLTATTRMDPYNFFSFPWLESASLAIMLVVLFNLALSVVAWLVFLLLRQWLYRENRMRLGGFMRGVLTAFLPTMLVFICIVLLANPGGWIGFGVPLLIIPGAFLGMLALTEGDVVPNEQEKFWWTIIAFEIIIVLSLIGAAGVIVAYYDPSLTFASPEENVLIPWKLDFEALGYPEDEYLERFRIGMLCTYILTILYLAVFVGGYLVVTIRKSGDNRIPACGT